MDEVAVLLLLLLTRFPRDYFGNNNFNEIKYAESISRFN